MKPYIFGTTNARSPEEVLQDNLKNPLIPAEPIHLPTVELLIADGVDLVRTYKSIHQCCKHIQYGSVRVLSHLPGAETKIRPLTSIDEYSKFMVKEVCDYLTLPHTLVANWDGFVINPAMWDHSWLQYDYIGAPWPPELLHHDKYRKKRWLVGNGGFSLRSRRLQELTKKLWDKLDLSHPADDVIICQNNRGLLEDHGMVFPTAEVARKFSWECEAYSGPSFAVHKRIMLQ